MPKQLNFPKVVLGEFNCNQTNSNNFHFMTKLNLEPLIVLTVGSIVRPQIVPLICWCKVTFIPWVYVFF